MALASATETAIDFDAEPAVGALEFYGGLTSCRSTATPLVRSILLAAERGQVPGRAMPDS
jgi:hypothetical protein